MPTLAAWVHDWSPFLVRFTEGFGLRWYGLSYAAGFLAGWMIIRWFARRGLTPLPAHRVMDALTILVIGVVAGGRLGYVVFYEPSLLWTLSASPPWWGLLQLNRGGMASHGGIIGVIVASGVVARGFKTDVATGAGGREGKTSWLHVLDLTAIACTPGLGFGRLANFVNGELLGRIVTPPGTDGPWWSVRFPQEVLSGHEPALTAEQQGSLEGIVESVRLPTEGFEGGYERVLRLLQSGPREVRERLTTEVGPLLASRHPSQLYQAVADGLILGAVLWIVWWKPRRPGIVGAWFMIVYGVMRIATEVYRLPDAQFAQGRPLGLSRGQWLSVGMIAVGAVAIPVITRRGAAKMGGWGRRGAGVSP